MSELRKIDALGARDGFISTHDGVGENVEVLLFLGVSHAANNLREWARHRQLVLDR